MACEWWRCFCTLSTQPIRRETRHSPLASKAYGYNDRREGRSGDLSWSRSCLNTRWTLYFSELTYYSLWSYSAKLGRRWKTVTKETAVVVLFIVPGPLFWDGSRLKYQPPTRYWPDTFPMIYKPQTRYSMVLYSGAVQQRSMTYLQGGHSSLTS